jgi:hypothetical protein
MKMRNTGVTDVYGLSIPVAVESASGVTTHRYTNGDDFNVIVKDTGAEKVTVAIFMPAEPFLLEEKKDVAKDDVQDVVRSLFGRYRF